MSRTLDLTEAPKKVIDAIHSDLTLRIDPGNFNLRAPPEVLYVYEVLEEDDPFLNVNRVVEQKNPPPKRVRVNVPFNYLPPQPDPDRVFPYKFLTSEYPSVPFRFGGTLRTEQIEIRKKTIEALNGPTRSFIIAAFPGFGKSITSLSVMARVKLRVLIIISRKILIDQWIESIHQFCPGTTVELLTPALHLKKKKLVAPRTDVSIINALNIPKFGQDFFREIGFVVVDEIHLIMSRVLSRGMNFLTPRYVLGLSATPYRLDGLNSLMDLYFGTKKIHIPLSHAHKVYRVSTNFAPTQNYVNKRIDWGEVIRSQSASTYRNELIIELVKRFSDRTFLILCKRVGQANYLVSRLVEEKETVTQLIGSDQTYDKSARVLVGIIGKCGVGFNHPKLDTLLLACDVLNYWVQYLCRVIRSPEVEPVVFDLVDTQFSLNKHFEARAAVYTESGGKIYEFGKVFPKFGVSALSEKFGKNEIEGGCRGDKSPVEDEED